MLVALRVPADNPRGPLFMEQALAGIHQGNPKRLPLASFVDVLEPVEAKIFGLRASDFFRISDCEFRI